MFQTRPPDPEVQVLDQLEDRVLYYLEFLQHLKRADRIIGKHHPKNQIRLLLLSSWV